MANESQVAQIRWLIGDTEEPYMFTNDQISAEFDAAPSVNKVVYDFWIMKAASYSSVVDVAESGSSRRMGDLYDNAMNQARYYKGLLDEEAAVLSQAPFTVDIERN